MLTQVQKDTFQRNGFVLGGKVLSDGEVDVLRGEVERVIRDRDRDDVPQPVLIRNMGSEDAPVWQIINICDASEPFMRLVHNSEIAGTIADLMGAASLRLWHDQIQFKPAAKGGVNHWHQDAPYWPVLAPMRQITAWIALDDVDVDNGCMSMVPGSHLWGNEIKFLESLPDIASMPSEHGGHKVEVATCPVSKGYVHFHHALTWHGSSANHSGRPRRAIALHYMSTDTTFVGSADHIMKPFIDSADGEPIKGARFPVVWPG
jgi:phytanoyl-CoA hydroxylase